MIGDDATAAKALLIRKGIETCSSWGKSGGGTSALAEATLLEQVVNVAAIACKTPPESGIGEAGGLRNNQLAYGSTSAAADEAMREMLRAQEARIREGHRGAVLDPIRRELGPADWRHLSTLEGFEDTVTAMHAAALEFGSDGREDDVDAAKSPWGFDVTDLSVPTFLYWGLADNVSSIAYHDWYLNNLRNVPRRGLVTNLRPDLNDDRNGHYESFFLSPRGSRIVGSMGHLGPTILNLSFFKELKRSAEEIANTKVIEGPEREGHVASHVVNYKGKNKYWVTTARSSNWSAESPSGRRIRDYALPYETIVVPLPDSIDVLTLPNNRVAFSDPGAINLFTDIQRNTSDLCRGNRLLPAARRYHQWALEEVTYQAQGHTRPSLYSHL